MREIKFRGLANTGWEVGLLLYSHGVGDFKITNSNGWQPTYGNPDEGESTLYHSVDRKTVGQFTGLKDKNGLDIFEGDVLQTIEHNGVFEPNILIGKVEITTKGIVFGYGYCDDFDDLEIIGNIHDNPELLK